MAKTTKTKGKQRELNSDQRLFCELYLATHPRNGTKCYMEVYGVTDENVAAAAASRLLKNVKVQEYLAKREKQIFAKRFEVTQENIAAEISAIARAKASDFYYFDGQKCTFKSFDDIPLDLHGAIKAIETETDPVTKITTKIKVWFYDKNKALEMLARHKQMFKDGATLTLEAGDTLKAFLEAQSGKTIGPPAQRKPE